jgi:serine/threonine-protein kinase
MSIAAGTKLGHYEIRSKIGEGGMGEVYLAQDSNLDRRVALKILPPDFAVNRDRMRRFTQEAKAAAALNHPNIAHIYEIGESEGINFIAMEFVDGQTLRRRMDGTQMRLAENLKVAIQIANALTAAHAAGIVHRDIKPDNAMLRPDFIVKVLDFGLAKLTEPTSSDNDSLVPTRALVQTEPGTVMGTVAYMSPEQLRGLEVDARSDIWSLGAVLYEMVAGRTAFAGETSSHIGVSILESEPAPLSRYAPEAPAELQRIVRKALTKDRDSRYQTARDLMIDLKSLHRDLDIQSEMQRSSAPDMSGADSAANQQAAKDSEGASSVQATSLAEARPTRSDGHTPEGSIRYRLGALVAMLLLAVGALGLWYYFQRRAAGAPINSIAVMPFVNASGNNDVEYLSEGMTESLITSLSQLPKLSVKARSSVFRYQGKDTSPQQVGKELNVQAIVNGRMMQHGNELTLHIELVDVSTETALWSGDYKRSMTDLVSLQSEIASDVSTKLQLKLSGADQQKLAKNYTANTEAYQLYLKGRFYWNRRTGENLKRAIEQFQQAADKDPNYALAYVGLADCYQLLEEYAGTPATLTVPRANAYVERALQIDDSLAEAHVSLGGIKYKLWRWDESEQEFKRAIELNPNYPTAHHWYSVYLRSRRRFDDSFLEIKRAQELDPLSLIINDNVGQLYLVRGDDNAAVEQYKKVIDLDGSFVSGRRWFGKTLLKQRRFPEALAELQKAVELSGRATADLGALGYGFAVAGKRAEALAVLKELEDKYARHEARELDLAVVHIGLGEKDQAFTWIEKAYQVRSGNMSYLSWDIFYDSLRADPRYVDLLRRIGLN